MLGNIHKFYYESVDTYLNTTTYIAYMVMKFHCNFMDIYKSFNILANPEKLTFHESKKISFCSANTKGFEKVYVHVVYIFIYLFIY